MKNTPPPKLDAELTAPDGARIIRFRLAKGDAGIWQTLAAMSELSRNAAKSEPIGTLAAIARTLNHREPLPLGAIYTMMKNCATFRADPLGVEWLRDPAAVAALIVANKKPLIDCDDRAMLTASIIIACGGRALFGVCSRQDEPLGPFVHVFPGAEMPAGNALWLDAQENIPIGQLPPCGRVGVWRVNP
jgi:hypothetical protein